MSNWNRVTIDNLIDLKNENATNINNLLGIFDKIECLFNDMISTNITLEQSLLQLNNTVVSEGILTGSAVSTYNSFLVNYANTLDTLLNMKVPSVSGIAANLIKPWSIDQKTYTYNISFKLPNYNWVYNSPLCVIDNMAIASIDPCPVFIISGIPPNTTSSVPNLIINIGCSTINIPQYIF